MHPVSEHSSTCKLSSAVNTSLLNSNGISLCVRSTEIHFELYENRNKRSIQDNSRSSHSSCCQTDKVKSQGFFSKTRLLSLYIVQHYFYTQPHTHTLIFFSSSLSSHRTLFFHAQRQGGPLSDVKMCSLCRASAAVVLKYTQQCRVSPTTIRKHLYNGGAWSWGRHHLLVLHAALGWL